MIPRDIGGRWLYEQEDCNGRALLALAQNCNLEISSTFMWQHDPCTHYNGARENKTRIDYVLLPTGTRSQLIETHVAPRLHQHFS